ncbi:monocarboxylate transporter 6-like [Acanthaster planci]|uniref:Monocarboxylate transporter 6-like n=1 Tax=Acanthaster planci TaxID=133434 RepID=A0A8B7XJ48_ACAPL|nr:monocarboxylate transporter 6-like [Acanthaster planci]XP_022080825.1 monocarboxylate transporter 6-like [Acanthaster planci]XP_022080826.1 monocarboxylate transporter 6-like [Acanthaster planci]
MTPPSAVKAPPFDGGWGLVVAVAAHAVLVLAMGMYRCSGVFFTSWLHEFEASALSTGAIGSIIGSCAFFASPLAAFVCDRYGCRFAGILGGMVTVVGLFASCWVRTIYQMYVAGAITGCGTSFAVMTAVVVVNEYFKKYFAIANGFVMSGVGVGMVVQPLLLRLLLDGYGWRGALMILAGLSANLCVAGALFRPLKLQWGRTESKRGEDLELQRGEDEQTNATMLSSNEDNPRSVQDGDERAYRGCLSKVLSALGFDLLLKNSRFALYCIIQTEVNISYLAYIVFIVPRSESIDAEGASAASLVSIIGFGSLFGRLMSGCLINRKLTAEDVYVGSTLICFVGVLSAQLDTYAAFAVSAALVGLGTGLMKAAHNVLVRDFVGVTRFGRGLGMTDIFRGTGDLLGPIIAGQLYDVTGSYAAIFYVLAAILLLIPFQMVVLMPILKRLNRASCSCFD